MSQAITAADYFKQNAHLVQSVQEVPLNAYKVQPGDSVIYGLFSTTAEAAGWNVREARDVYTDEEFAEHYVDVKIEQEDLPQGTVVEPVKKGEVKIFYPFGKGLGVQAAADTDGFRVTFPDEAPVFLSDAEFTRSFKTQHTPSGNSRMVTLNRGGAPAVAVQLPASVTFAFKAGDYEAKAGMWLVPNNRDEDGYTVYAANNFEIYFDAPKP